MDYVPDRIIKADNLLNKFMLSFNIIIPIFYSATMIIGNFIRMRNKGTDPAWLNWSNRGFNILAVASNKF